MAYVLLMRDYEIISEVALDVTSPPTKLYDLDIHKRRCRVSAVRLAPLLE